MKPIPEGWAILVHRPWSPRRPMLVGPGGIARVWQLQIGSAWVACDGAGQVVGGVSSPRQFDDRDDAIRAAIDGDGD